MKPLMYPAAALALGGVGYGLRVWQNATCFAGDGLPISGPATPAMIAFTVAAAVIAAALAGLPRWTPVPLCAVFAKNKAGAQLLRLTAVPCLLFAYQLSSQLEAFSVSSAAFSTAQVFLPRVLIVLAVCAVLSVAALPSWTQGEPKAPLAFSPAVMVLFSGLALIILYQLHANIPNVLLYVWMLFAGLAGLMAWLCTASMAYTEKPRIRRCVFFAFLAVVMSCVSLADAAGPFLPLFIAQILWFSIQLGLMADER